MPVEMTTNPAHGPALSPEQRTASPAVKLSPAASLVLDIVRFAAAIMVAVGHYTLPMFSAGLPLLITYAAAAVGVFFVLSGFVISYVTQSRHSTLVEYFVDRASRLFSVVVPALCFTVVADLIRSAILPGPGFMRADIGDYTLRIAASLTFTSQMWTLYLVPWTNDPFWSLSFEAFYYVMYGLAFYLRGWRRIAALTAICLVGGPGILFLAPAWFFGCVLHDLYQRCRRSPRASARTLTAVLAICVVSGLAAIARPVRDALHTANVAVNHQAYIWGYHKGQTLFLYSALGFGLALIAILILVERLHFSPKSRAVRALRFIADGTFPLYLFHEPMLFLLRSIWHYDLYSRVDFAIILVSIVMVCVLLGPPCNWLKNVLRRKLMKAFGPRPVETAPSYSL
jgi:peptidoglycan/LPS O-acetylase OafA/YrhL